MTHQIQVVQEGESGILHRHDMQEAELPSYLGEDFEPLDDTYARYKYFYICKCGKSIVVSNVAFI